MEKACCVLGQRARKLPWADQEERPDCMLFKERLHSHIVGLVRNGITTFYTNMSDGVNMIAAETVLQVRSELPDVRVRLIGVLPYEEQAARWTVPLRDRYFNTMAQADDEVMISSHYTKTCYQECMDYIVEHSSHIIVVINGEIGRMQSIVDTGKDRDIIISFIDIGDMIEAKG